MSYIGTPPSNAFTSLLKQDFSTSATTGYTLDHAVNNANDIALFINFVRQEPTAGYAASGTTLTLTSATASTDDMYCVYLGQALQTVNPANASVGLSQLTATGTKDATTFLRGDNTFDTPVAGGITVAHQWRLTTSFATTSTVPIASNWEQVDTYGYGGIGTVMSESSGVFSFPSTGIYLINFVANVLKAGDTAYWKVRLDTTVDGSNYNIAADSHGGIKQVTGDTLDSCSANFMFDVTDVSTHKVRFGVEAAASTTYLGSTNRNQTFVTFTRLGDT